MEVLNINLKRSWFALVWKTIYIMRTNFDFISGLFNNAVQTSEQVNNLQVNAYKVRVDGNVASIEAMCINEYGVYGTSDVRTIYPTMKQLNRLQRLANGLFVYED